MKYNINRYEIERNLSEKQKNLVSHFLPYSLISYLLAGFFKMKTCKLCGKVIPQRNYCPKCRGQIFRKRHPNYEKNYYSMHKKEKALSYRKWKSKNREKLREIKRQWRINNPTLVKQEKTRYYKCHKSIIIQAINKYRKTLLGKIRRIKENSKRRKYGNVFLNEPFENSSGHHIDNNYIVFIPKEIHLKFNCNNTQKHRQRLLNYYGSIENMRLNNKQK